MIAERLNLEVHPDAEGSRLDRFLAQRLVRLTRSAVGRLIRDGRVCVDGSPAPKPGLALKRGMQVRVDFPAPSSETPQPESIPVEVVYEDEYLVVVDKPAGLVVHPGHGCGSGTLVNALLGRGTTLAPAGGVKRPGIVHRLDKETSGLLVVAKTDPAHRSLSRAFASRNVRKRYDGLAWGHPKPPRGRIARAIGRSRSHPTRMAVRGTRGRVRDAVTLYDTRETMPGFAWLSLDLRTGRTHQIRVHMQSIHHPLVGDDRYGGRQWRSVQDPRKRKALAEFRRLALHAADLSFPHPETGRELSLHAPLPAELRSLLDTLRSTA
jgi:23S rRNA pseudouridine1911/1915/1917 synthase